MCYYVLLLLYIFDLHHCGISFSSSELCRLSTMLHMCCVLWLFSDTIHIAYTSHTAGGCLQVSLK